MLDRLRDVFKSFQAHDVRYVVIGGVAAVVYGVPRQTFDLDILVAPDLDNAKRLLTAMLDAGFGTADLTTPEDVVGHEITIFKDRVRIDVQTSTPGINFEEAWRDRQTIAYLGVEIHVVSREHLIASKRAAGRPVDLEDVRQLEQAEKCRPTPPGERPV